MANDNKNGFYGPDGEFYPAGSQAAQQTQQQYQYQYQNDDLYPRRPDINYTTQPMPQNPPANRQQYGGNINGYNIGSDAAPSRGSTVYATPNAVYNTNQNTGYSGATKYCKFCGTKIPEQAVICTNCGCQVEEIRQQQAPQPVIVNNNVNTYANNNNNVNTHGGKAKNKWLAFFLCLFGGGIGLHKFYEGKIIAGIVYACTGGLFGVGWFIDIIALLLKPNPYYV